MSHCRDILRQLPGGVLSKSIFEGSDIVIGQWCIVRDSLTAHRNSADQIAGLFGGELARVLRFQGMIVRHILQKLNLLGSCRTLFQNGTSLKIVEFFKLLRPDRG